VHFFLNTGIYLFFTFIIKQLFDEFLSVSKSRAGKVFLDSGVLKITFLLCVFHCVIPIDPICSCRRNLSGVDEAQRISAEVESMMLELGKLDSSQFSGLFYDFIRELSGVFVKV
jgi:hypothetical protein